MTGPDVGPSPAQRALVLAVLALLLVGGIAVVETWPVTGWRLFDQERRAEQSGWSVQAVAADGALTRVALGDLPMGYRLAGWPLSDAIEPRSANGPALCDALLDEVRDDLPDTVGLRILHTRQRLVELDGGWWRREVAAGEVLRCGEARP